MENKKITIWKRFRKKEGEYFHNHIEDGWVNDDTPRPRSDLQKSSWPSGVWKKSFGYLIYENNKMPRVVDISKFNLDGSKA